MSDGIILVLTGTVGVCAALVLGCVVIPPKLRKWRRNRDYWRGLVATPYGVAPDRRWLKMLLDTRRTTVGLLVIRRAK